MNNKINYLFGFTLTILTHTGNALPTDGMVISGDIDISTNGNNMNINQGTNKAIIDWRGFDIAKNERVDFYQPNANSITLNRITGGDISHINGQLNANGKLFLVNSNGIVFGKNSQVNVSGLLATTSQITNSDFNTGNYKFSNTNSNSQIINNGNISIKDAGFASLVAPSVQNNGLINARLGKVTIGSADAFTLDLYGDGLIKFDISKQVESGFVGNSGKIIANGGIVTLSTDSVVNAVEEVINTSGVIEAKTAQLKDGVIILSGGKSGKVLVSGDLSAKKVKVLGDKVGLLSGAKINTGEAGEVLIGGNFQGKGAEQNANYTYVDKNATIDASNENGNGGKVIVWADKNTQFYGDIKATGNNGNGGFAEVSGKDNLVFRGKVDLTAKNGNKGTLLLDPKNITIADGGVDIVANNDIFNENPTLDATFDADLITTALDGANLVLQANNDITVNEAIDSSSGGAGDLSLVAGRSIIVNENIKLNGNFVATVNSENAIAANRDAGDASFTLASGKNIDTTTGNKNITIDYENGANGNDSTGAMNLSGLLNSGGGTIILNTTANDGGSASREMITTNGVANADIISNNLGITGEAITLSKINISNSLVIDATGNVSQINAWSIANETTLNATGKNIVLNNALNNFAQSVSISAKDVTLKNSSSLTLGTSNITGNTIINASGINDSGVITANGAGTSFEVNSSNGIVSLNGFNHDFTTIKGSSSSNQNFSVKDVNGLDIGALTVNGNGNLNISTSGEITSSGSIIAAGGITTIDAGANTITLEDAANNFATLDLKANNAAIKDVDALILAESEITTNANITTGGNLTQSGFLTINGDTTVNSQNLTFDNVNNEFIGEVKITSGNVIVKDKNTLKLGASNISGSLNVNAIDVEIVSDISTNGDIDIDGSTNLGGNLLSNGNNISLKNVSFSGGAKTINSNGGNISFTKITGTDDSRLRLLAGGENAVGVSGGTINGDLDVNELFISGSGGALTGSLRSVNPNNSRKAAEAIGTSPVPHGGNFTFNGYRLIGKSIDGELNILEEMNKFKPLVGTEDEIFVTLNTGFKFDPKKTYTIRFCIRIN
jgi:filamentous hemagglutinin family protein